MHELEVKNHLDVVLLCFLLGVCFSISHLVFGSQPLFTLKLLWSISSYNLVWFFQNGRHIVIAPKEFGHCFLSVRPILTLVTASDPQ